ncbi:metallophosphoesterase [Methanothermobacter wolfeii]|uniref:metallophosphoesterase n=1 Tax=Methanothermobacter wolfeii TaxID=145261 RepID=UPI0019C80B23|nr:metallophosphoesterase [Methanothermobacter wolfeii]MBC7112301.1 metallophosphoesterase [Methanothermobacter sp.]MDI6702671.1 metallophosphoesterase [Methanothermobacter wolfeii]
MLIGVISDTHIPDRAEEIPEMVFRVFSEVELILHAGDLTSMEVVHELETLAPVECVQGNMDRYHHTEIPRSRVLEIESLRIGLNHGEVYPRGDTQQLRYIGLELDADVLITGHTHQPFITELRDILLLNPGSPTVPRLTDPSVMLLRVEDDKLDAEIVKVGAPVCRSLQFGGAADG